MIPSVISPFTFFDNLAAFAGLFVSRKERFMVEFKNITQHKYCFDVSGGRVGLMLILKSLKSLQPEKRNVLVSSLTCGSVGFAVKSSGLEPVYYDIEQTTFGPDVNDLKNKINHATLAVISSSLFGYANQLDDLSELCRSRSVFLIEDNAHVLGIEYNGKTTGNYGDACFYSFGPSKSVSMISGGMACTNDIKIADAIDTGHQLLRKGSVFQSVSIFFKHIGFYLISKPFIFSMVVRFKNEFKHTSEEIKLRRMNNVQFSLGITGLLKLKNINQIRKMNAATWTEILKNSNVQLQQESSNTSYLRFPLLASSADECARLVSEFRKRGVWAVRSIFIPLHNEDSINKNASDVYERMILLPAGRKIRQDVFERIKKMLNQYENKENQK